MLKVLFLKTLDGKFFLTLFKINKLHHGWFFYHYFCFLIWILN
jgi:hypothetical protein